MAPPDLMCRDFLFGGARRDGPALSVVSALPLICSIVMSMTFTSPVAGSILISLPMARCRRDGDAGAGEDLVGHRLAGAVDWLIAWSMTWTAATP